MMNGGNDRRHRVGGDLTMQYVLLIYTEEPTEQPSAEAMTA